MVRQRIYGLLADYEDQNDHDELRSDPVFKLIAGRLPEDRDLASQPTLSRFENAVTIPDLKRLQECLMQQFLDGFEEPPVPAGPTVGRSSVIVPAPRCCRAGLFALVGRLARLRPWWIVDGAERCCGRSGPLPR